MMRRFTIAPERIMRGHVAFDADESRHLSRVLRLRPGDTVIATDGAGHDYTVRLDTVGAQATGIVLRVTTHDADPKQDSNAWKSKDRSRLKGGRQAAGSPLSFGERGKIAAQTYPIVFFHSASCSRIAFQSPGTTFGTYGSFGIVVPQPSA